MFRQIIVPILLGLSFTSGAPAIDSVVQSNNTAPDAAVTQDTSANWSGYVAGTATYSAVGGSWSVPVPTDTHAGNSLSTDATWVGIGGVQSRDLIQAGTQALVQNGSVAYQAWYELLPDGQHILPLAVHGGDSVSVSLTEISPDVWYLYFANNTTGKAYTQQLSYHSSHSSAEWIEEMPVLADNFRAAYAPLDNFGRVSFTGGYTVANGTRVSIASAGAQSLTMATRGGEALALPSVLAVDSFSISRSSVQAPQTIGRASENTSNTRAWRGRGGHHIVVITFGI